MSKEALKLALEALETELAVDMTNGAEIGEAAELMCEAITALKEALSEKALQALHDENERLGLYEQRPWVGLMRGVRVEGDTVVISVHYGNDAARQLCGDLIKEMNGGHSAP